jgi:hypothetical protein
MENVEYTLRDAEAIVKHIRGVGANDVIYDDKETLHYLGRVYYPPGPFMSLRIRMNIAEGTCVSTVSTVSPLLAGMVLAEVRPDDRRIRHGVGLSSFAELLEDLFPQLETNYSWYEYPQFKVTLTVDPLQQSYFEKIETLFPPFPGGAWRQLRTGYCFESYGIDSCDMGAYLWKTSKTS